MQNSYRISTIKNTNGFLRPSIITNQKPSLAVKRQESLINVRLAILILH